MSRYGMKFLDRHVRIPKGVCDVPLSITIFSLFSHVQSHYFLVMKRILLLMVALLMMAEGLIAQQIKSVVLTIIENGKTMTESIPAEGMPVVDLTDEVTNSLIIDGIEIETTGTVTDVAVCGSMYYSNETANGWRTVPIPNQGSGKWGVSGMGMELVEGNDEGTRIFEFYVQAKDGTGNAIYYNNGGANYKVVFTKAENDQWTVKYYKENTATLTLVADNRTLFYEFSDDMVRTSSEMPGGVSSLRITNYWTRFIVNDTKNIRAKSVSLQYKVYEEGTEGGWNGLEGTYVKDEYIYNEEKKRYDHRYDYSYSGDLDVTSGLTPGKKYVLEIMYQIVDNTGDYTMLGQNNEDSRFYFTIKDDGDAIGSIPTSQSTQNGTLYDLSGRRVKPQQKGLYIRDGRKVVR